VPDGIEVRIGDPAGGPSCRLIVSGEASGFADEASRSVGPSLLVRLASDSTRPVELLRLLATAVLSDGAPTGDELRSLIAMCDDPAIRELAAAHPGLPADVLRELLVDPVRQVRLAALGHPAADSLGDDLLPSSGASARAVGQLDDPWPRRWMGRVVSSREVAGVVNLDAAGVYRDEPLAQMFDSSFPTPLAVEVVGVEEVTFGHRSGLEELADAAEELWVVRSVDDPRAWVAVGLDRTGDESWQGRWTTSGMVLSPWLLDPRCRDAVIEYVSVEDRSLPLAVASVLAAMAVLAPGSPHDGRAALGSVMVPGWWRRGWISPLSAERSMAMMMGTWDGAAATVHDLLIHDQSRQVRHAIARCSAGADPDDLLVIAPLATDRDPSVRLAFASSQLGDLDRLPHETLEAMVADPSVEIRRLLADAPSLPDDLRALLVDDPDPEAAAAAESRSGDGPRCGWHCVGHKGLTDWDCERVAEIQATLDDGSTIGLCREHRRQLNPWGPRVRCTACGINPAIHLDLTGDSGQEPPTPVCSDCGDWIADLNNGGVTTGARAWADYERVRDRNP
jgi:hypothetical protein